MSNNEELPTPPLVVSSSNPQSGDCAYREKNQQVIIELLTSSSSDEEEGSSDEEEEPAPAKKRNVPRHSTSSGEADHVICLDSDDDDDAPALARASTESSVSSAQVRSDEEEDEPVVEEPPVPKNSSGSTAAAPSTTEAVVRPEPARSCAVFPSSARSTPAALNRQSTGSTCTDPVSLFSDSDDDDCAKTEKKKESKDSTLVPHRPVLDNKYSDSSHDYSDSSHDSSDDELADQRDNIRKKSSTIEFIDSSSSEEDDMIEDQAKKTTPNRIDTIYMDSSSDDEDETKSSEPNRYSEQGPSKPRTNPDGRRGSSDEPFLILSDDTDDDEIPEVAFSPSKGAPRQQNSNHGGAPSEFAPSRRKMAARKMTRPSRACFLDEAEPEEKASPKTLQTEKSQSVPQDKKSQEILEKTKLKPPPRSPLAVATTPPPPKVASRKLDLKSSSTDASSSSFSRASLPATLPPKAASRRLDMHFGSKDAYAGSSSSSSSAALSDPPKNPLHTRSGAAHGSHLASIYITALAEQKPLDVREVQLTDTPKEPDLPPKSAPDDRILSIKRKRRYNEGLDFGERGLNVEVPYQPDIVGLDCDNDDDDSFQEPTSKRQCIDEEVSRRREEIARRHQAKTLEMDRNFTGGEDPPLDILNGKGRDLDIMSMVELLSSQYIDEPTGLPVSKFSVFGRPDDIIYDFELRVKTSTIPNSGKGVFLTFLGARELKPSKKRRGEELFEARVFLPPKLSKPLHAWHPVGFGTRMTMHMTLTGEHLRAPYNSNSLLPTLEAILPGAKLNKRGIPKKTNIRFSDFDLPYCEDELVGLKDPSNRIGFLGLYEESDFVEAPRRTFSSLHENCGYIDIGRYGPFREEDRKQENIFDVKSFLFNFEPNEWSFGVSEKLCGKSQIIDITDDLTGEPHEIAKQNIPMYVNEIGHNKTLKHTVHSRDLCDRVVEYYLKIEEPMKKGETIEVFVNYFDLYEKNRIRKGYGIANIEGREKGDDHLPSLMRRNFQERQDMEEAIEDLAPMELYVMIEWLDSIRQGLHELVTNFLRDARNGRDTIPRSCPTAQQFIAIRRLHWLSALFKSRNDVLKEAPDAPVVGRCVFEQCGDLISRMIWPSWGAVSTTLALNPNLEDSKGVNVKNLFDREVAEELCYAVKEKLLSPMDESVWCDVAVQLTRNLCDATATAQDPSHPSSTPDKLVQAYMAAAIKAAQEVRNPSNLSLLAFDSNFQGDCGVSDEVLEAFQKVHMLSASLANRSASEKVLVARANPLLSPEGKHELIGVPVPASGFANQQLQETWYLCWQVAFVVDAFARKFLVNSSCYSLDDLCSRLGINAATASLAIAKGLKVIKKQAKRGRSRKREARNDTARPKKSKNSVSQSDKPALERANNKLFWNILWPCLKDELHWHLEHGNRGNDFYACPPGVTRGQGFSSRVHFFDSVAQIIHFLKSSPKWSIMPQIQSCLKDYYKCKDFYDSAKGAKPNFQNQEGWTNWLRNQVKVAA